MRYCPMCNRRTGEAVEVVEPFTVESCQSCGHVHRVGERKAADAFMRGEPLKKTTEDLNVSAAPSPQEPKP